MTDEQSTRPISGVATALERFLDAQEAIRELVLFAEEHVAPLDQAKRLLPSLMPAAPADPAPVTAAAAAVDQLMNDMAALMRTTIDEKAATGQDDDTLPPHVHDEIGRLATEFGETFRAAVPKGANKASWLLSLLKHRSRRPRLDVLLASLLTSAVGDFEVLFGVIVREFYRAYPDALKSDDSKFSYADISGYSTLDQFQEWFVDRRVESLLRAGLDDWYDWLQRRTGISRDAAVEDFDGLLEVFQRRHVIVHNGGRVSRQYQLKLKSKGGGAGEDVPKLGKQLAVTSEYLLGALDRLTSAGAVTALSVMWKFARTDGDHQTVESRARSSVYDLLLEGRARSVEAITAAIADKARDDETRILLRVNLWIARKQLRGLDAIRDDVAAWQTSALRPKFELAKLALMDEHGQASKLATKLLKQGEITQEDFDAWPLLEEVRAYASRSQGVTPDGPGDSVGAQVPQGEAKATDK